MGCQGGLLQKGKKIKKMGKQESNLNIIDTAEQHQISASHIIDASSQHNHM